MIFMRSSPSLRTSMKKYLLPLLFFLILVASCQKDNPASSKELLYQVIGKRGSDSIVSTFWYDAQNRLSKEFLEDGFVVGQTYTLTVTRDNNGRVTRIIDDVKSFTSGSQTTDFFYLSDTDKRIKYGKLVRNDTAYIDSMVYEYNSGLVTGVKHFLSGGSPYRLGWYDKYSYDSRNNIISYKFYEPDAGGINLKLKDESLCTYDDKINPYYSKDDAFIDFLEFPWNSPNNMTSRRGVAGMALNITYEYRTDGRPARRTSAINGQITVYTYYYR